MDSDPKSLMARRFGLLRNEILLYRQVEIADLEQRLLDLDHEDSGTCPRALKSKIVDESQDKKISRKSIIEEIDQKPKAYGK